MLVAGESGKLVSVNAGIDLSTASEIELTIIHPRTGVATIKKLSTADLSVGVVDSAVEIERNDGAIVDKTFSALQYVTFSTEEEDFPISGQYPMKLRALFPGGKDYRSETQYQPVLP